MVLGSGSHPSRYDLSGKRHVLISTCGFYSAEGNYDGVKSLFDHIEEMADARWQDIARGGISGQEALMRHQYRVVGGFNLMIHWDEYFAGGQAGGKSAGTVQGQNRPEKRSLLLYVLPFAVFWATITMYPELGAHIAIITAAAVPLFLRAFALTLYDAIGSFSVIVLSIASLYLPLRLVLAASYGVFAALWLVSSLCTKMPLSAWYVAKNYGNEAAYGNPLFIRTNKIIDIGWGIVYAVCCLLMAAGFYMYAVLVNTAGTIGMGLFTLWFQRWYPAHYARKAK
jgi:hypothetical protein